MILHVRLYGINKNYTLDHYIDAHTSSYVEILELKEPVPEIKKVSHFLASISDSKLDMAKVHVLGIDKSNENFDEYHKYVNTFNLNVRTNNVNSSAISIVDVNPQTGNNQKIKRGIKRAKKRVPLADWSKPSKDDQ